MGTIWLPDFENSSGPKYRILESAIKKAIHDGVLAPGTRLPPVRELGWEAQVTPGTVARAYKSLVDSGVLEAAVGRGTFVPERLKPIDTIGVDPGATLLSPRLPDMGQGDLIRAGFVEYSKSASAEELLRYPRREFHRPAHETFARYHAGAPIGPFTADDVVITHGGQNAIIMILQAVLRGTAPVVMIDDLTYSGFRRAAELCRAKVVSVPWDNEGPDPDEFERLIRDEGVQAYCTSADVINPTAQSPTLERRQKIAEIAQRLNIHVIDDDCYRNGPHEGPSYRQLLPVLGWYTTSPSKSVSAALRIGFVVAPTGWVNTLIRTATFNSFGVPVSITSVYTYVHSHPELPGILSAARAHMNSMLNTAVSKLKRYNIRWRENVPFIWLELPYGWRSGEFCQAAEANGVYLKSSEEFGLRHSQSVHAVRIALNGEIAQSAFHEALNKICYILDHPPEQITV